MNEQLLYDKRLVDRHIARGLIEKTEYEKRIAALPDVEEKAASLASELTSVGVGHKTAEDTGETE